MKIKQIVIAGTLLISVAAFAQKDELKALKKIYAKSEIKGADLAEYKSLIVKVESLAVEESDKVYAGFYKSMTPVLEYLALDKTMTPLQIQMTMAKFVSPKSISDLASGLNATLDFEKKSGKKVYTDDIIETITSFKPEMLNYAIRLGNEKKEKEASAVLYSIYLLDKKDQENLYYAANYAVNGQDYENALKYYLELKTINYSGEKTLYYAKSVVNGEEQYMNTKAERDNLIKLKTHVNPRDEKVTSKRGEIYKNIALILVQNGKNEEAKAAISEARKANPDDVSLILTEADLYYKLKDLDSYKRLINEALEKNPNDADLIFNLGVVSNAANQLEDAKKYYLRAIELRPDFVDAYLNLSDINLRPDGKLVEEMNNLGTSDKELKRYDILKEERKKIFNKSMPLLEKALELSEKLDQSIEKNKNQTAVVKSNLKTVYGFLELTEKSKALKERK